MITELFSMLSSIDVGRSGNTKKFNINLNRNHIRSISAYSSNSIFYFTTIVTDQATPEELGMVSRVLEKSYASFVVTCISLMPFHRVRADDQASIEDYLSQFHQNMGIKAGGGAMMTKVLGLVDTLEESAMPINEKALSWVNEDGDDVPRTCPDCGSKVGVFLHGEPVYMCTNKDCKKAFGVVECNESAVEDAAVKATQDFLLECWEKSRKTDTDFIKIVTETVSLNDMYQVDPIDPVTRVMQETYFANLKELKTWGFIGEATADMFDDPDDRLLDMSDEEIVQSVYSSFNQDLDSDLDELEQSIEDEYGDLDSLLDESTTSFDDAYSKAEGMVSGIKGALMAGAVGQDGNVEIQIKSLLKAAQTIRDVDKVEQFAKKYCSYYWDSKAPMTAATRSVGKSRIQGLIDRRRDELKSSSKKNVNESSLNEGNVKAAIDSIMFSLESVSENKILSCSSLTKLNTLEAKLNKLKNKYAKYLTRYKRKFKENQEKGTKSKLSIRFNGATISNPKAFMKQYGAYIKIINKRLKLVEKRRAELRKRKGLPDKSSEKLEESALTTLSDLDLQVIDHCISVIDEAISAPDDKVFIIHEDTNAQFGLLNEDFYSHRRDDYFKAKNSGDKAKADSFRYELIQAGMDPDPNLPPPPPPTQHPLIINTSAGGPRVPRSGGSSSGGGSRSGGGSSSSASSGYTSDQIQQMEDDINDLQAELASLATGSTDAERAAYNRGAAHGAQKAGKDAQKRIQELEKNQRTASDAERQKKLIEAEKRASALEKDLKSQRNITRQERLHYQAQLDALNSQIKVLKDGSGSSNGKPDMTIGGTDVDINFDPKKAKSNINLAKAYAQNYRGHSTFDKEIFTNMEMKKANEALPTFAKATIGFIVDETEQVVTRDVLVGIKVQLHKIAAMDLINDIYSCIINKRQFLKFVKFISGEEKSLADLLFGFKELKLDAVNSTGARRWNAAFRRRKRWSKASVPYLMKNYTPNGTVVITMNEVQFIRDEYGVDIMTPEHVEMLMDAGFLLGFVVLDQANEVCYITYDGHGGNFQEYTYAMLEREQQNSDRMIRELYRSMSR